MTVCAVFFDTQDLMSIFFLPLLAKKGDLCRNRHISAFKTIIMAKSQTIRAPPAFHFVRMKKWRRNMMEKFFKLFFKSRKNLRSLGAILHLKGGAVCD